MKLRIFAAVLACFAAAVAYAQGVDWPDQVPVGSLLVLDAPAGTACTWAVSTTDIDGATYDPVFREFPGALVVETRYGGALVIVLKTDAKRGLSEITWTILVGSDIPDPPDPIPLPSTKIFACLIEESDDRDEYTVEQVNAITAEEDTAYMTAHGYSYRKLDQDVKEPDGQGGERTPLAWASFILRAQSHASANGGDRSNSHLPRLIISDNTGKTIYHDEVVTGPVLEILKRYGGE